MKSAIKNLTFITVLVCIVSACNKKSSDPEPSSAFTPAPIAPTPVWYNYKTNAADTMRVGNGSVYLTASRQGLDTVASNVIYSIESLKGDFEITVSYSDFKRKDTGSTYNSVYDEIGLLFSISGTDSLCYSTLVRNGQLLAYDTTYTLSSGQLAHVNGTSGKVYLKRVGSTYTGWTTCGNGRVDFSKSNYITKDLTVYMFIHSNRQTDNSSFHIDDVSIVGSDQGLKSDPFDTNAIVTAP